MRGLNIQPIQSERLGFGVFGEYTGKKLTQLTSIGRDKVDLVSPCLKSQAQIYEKAVLQLEKATETLLRRHKKNIIEKQLAMKRVADIVIDIYVGLCVLSRVSRMIEEKSEADCQQEISIAKIFSQAAKRRIEDNFQGIEKNEDEEKKELADYIMTSEGYPWDTF